MIVLNKHPGQLCNRLWAYVPYITLCLKNNHKLLILHFDEYYHQFENLRTLTGIRLGEPYVLKKNHYWKWLFLHVAKPLPQRLLRFLDIYTDKEFWEREQWRAALVGRNANIIFLKTQERVQVDTSLPEFQEQIRQLFRPKQVYVDNVTQLVTGQREKHNVIMGVHIRRSDYRKFRRGAYYFNDATYCAYMSDMEQQLKAAGKSVVFLLCSEEPLQLSHFSGFETFQINSRADIEDLYALSLADYIMGVPSSFSMWASFYGKVPLRILQHKNEKLQLDQFSAIVSQNTFENGTRFNYNEKPEHIDPHHSSAPTGEWLKNQVTVKMGEQDQLKVKN